MEDYSFHKAVCFKTMRVVLCTSQNCQRDRCCQFQMYRGKANIAKQRCTSESIFRSRARGLMPGSTHCFLGLSTREEIQSSSLSGPPLQPPAQKTVSDLVVPIRAAKGMYENRKACLPCRKAVRHAHKGKCPTVCSCPTVSTRKCKFEINVGKIRRQDRGFKRETQSSPLPFFFSLSPSPYPFLHFSFPPPFSSFSTPLFGTNIKEGSE